MHRDLRSSRFRRRDDMGEDVNPSAYIVNLADCMLVLALGFLVALISFWNIDLTPVSELDESNMQEVAPETLDAETLTDGSYYIEAGTVYQDPNTGEYYLLQENGTEPKAGSGSASSQADGTAGSFAAGGSGSSSGGGAASGASGSSAGAAGASGSSAPSSADIAKSRAAGAD